MHLRMLTYRQAASSRYRKLIMNVLNRSCLKQFLRYKETVAAGLSKFYAEPLTKRTLIRVRGQEVVPFLQGLITNDMKHLYADGQQSMFAMFLNNSGRVLFDTIIYKTPASDTFLIECDRDISNDLRRHLRLYRVKKKIDIDSINSEYTPWVVYSPEERIGVPEPSDAETRTADILYSYDPRVRDLGIRIIQPKNYQMKDLAKFFPKNIIEQPRSSEYGSHRYVYGVGEGIEDHPPGKSLPFEANCDFLHGISFQKGCYVGQELTARTHHTGVIRKRLMPLKLSASLDGDVLEVQTQAGAVVGTIRGASDRQALALLRVEQVLNSQELMVDGDPCKAIKPYWWPKQLPIKQPFRYN